MTLLETAEEDSEATKKREAKAAEKVRDESAESAKLIEGGVLAADLSTVLTVQDAKNLKQKTFEKHLRETSNWMRHVFSDAVAFASDHTPREKDQLDRILRKTTGSSQPCQQSGNTYMFATSVWPSLKSRGWTSELMTDGNAAGKTRYSFQGNDVSSCVAWFVITFRSQFIHLSSLSAL
jgi:hypothetical protein